jgi:hypothetical protein
MNKPFLQTVSGAALAFSLVALSANASADDADNATQHRGHGVLEGTWMSVVSSGPGSTTPFLSMATYIPTGQIFEENNTPQIRSVGQGEWVRTGRGKFERTMLLINFQPLTNTGGMRTYTGVTRVHSDITLEPGGDSYNAVNRFDVYNPSGQLVTSGQNTSHANRCGFDSRIPVCLGLETAPK